MAKVCIHKMNIMENKISQENFLNFFVYETALHQCQFYDLYTLARFDNCLTPRRSI